MRLFFQEPGTHLAQISQLVPPPTARSGLGDPGRVVESLTAGHTAALFFEGTSAPPGCRGPGDPLWPGERRIKRAFLAPGRFPDPRKTRQVQGKRGRRSFTSFHSGEGYPSERSAQKRFSRAGMKRRVARVPAR